MHLALSSSPWWSSWLPRGGCWWHRLHRASVAGRAFGDGPVWRLDRNQRRRGGGGGSLYVFFFVCFLFFVLFVLCCCPQRVEVGLVVMPTAAAYTTIRDHPNTGALPQLPPVTTPGWCIRFGWIPRRDGCSPPAHHRCKALLVTSLGQRSPMSAAPG